MRNEHANLNGDWENSHAKRSVEEKNNTLKWQKKNKSTSTITTITATKKDSKCFTFGTQRAKKADTSTAH